MLFRPDLYVTPELIDTLWNVNMRLQFFAQPGGGINRYIMECKYVVFGSPL